MVRRALLALLVLAGAATGPVAAESLPGGERLVRPSRVMGEDRTVFVSLPASYATSGGRRYPVLYLTDGDWQFAQVRASAGFLARNGLMPEILVVAVTNPDRTRDLYASHADFVDGSRTIRFPTSGSADRFLEFFESELIPWVDTTYRTVPMRILAGHSAGGNFALHAMRTKPGLFLAIVAASPWLAWDDRKELKQLVPFLASDAVKARTLFVTSANENPGMKADLDAITAALRSRKDGKLRWSAATYPEETHDSVVLKSYYDALRMIFAGWEPPRDPNTNRLAGSLEDVKAHYARLGERLGYALPPPEGVINELGYRDLEAKETEAALAAFRYNAALYPESANVWDSLGDGLDRSGKKVEALASYRKAVSLAEANGGGNVEAFRKHVARLAGPDAALPK